MNFERAIIFEYGEPQFFEIVIEKIHEEFFMADYGWDREILSGFFYDRIEHGYAFLRQGCEYICIAALS